jgi:hypothetical protein
MGLGWDTLHQINPQDYILVEVDQPMSSSLCEW